MFTQNLKVILLLSFLLPTDLIGQEKDFYLTDNSYHEIFRKLKVKSLKLYTKEFDENGKLTEEYLELVQEFSKNGDIIKEREYLDQDKSDGWEVTYEYNKNHQIVKSEWSWYEDKSKELTTHQYDANHTLVKSCDYKKEDNDEQYELDSCQLYKYKNNLLDKVISSDGSLVYRYQYKDGIVLKFNAKNELKSKYQHGELIYSIYDKYNYEYYKNSIGQLIKSIEVDPKGKRLDETVFEYENGLLMKSISKDALGRILYTEQYVYEYYK